MSQAAIEMRIKAFEQFEACMSQDSGARPCCKQTGALRAAPSDRIGNTIPYRCRTCGATHTRTFADLSEMSGVGGKTRT